MKQDEADLYKSLDYFERALDKDPGYVASYNGISFAWSRLADACLPSQEAYPKAKAAALKAIELDSSDADAQTMLATVEFFYERKWDACEARFRQGAGVEPAIRRCPSLLWPGAVRESIRTRGSLCSTARLPSTLCRRFRVGARNGVCALPVALRTFRATSADGRNRPDFFYIGAPLAMTYGEKGMLAQWLGEYERARRVTGRPVFGMALTLVRMGRADEARKLLQEFLDEARSRYVAPEIIASVYAALGESDQAFAWLDKAYEAHGSGPLAIDVLDLPYDLMRSDPRFAALQKKIGLRP